MAVGAEFITAGEIARQIAAGQLELWQLTPKAWGLLEFMPTKHGLTMNILTIVGKRSEWAAGLATLEKIAADRRCALIYSVGHPGWKKFVESRGFDTRLMLRMTKQVQR